jgi:hypothetical protein
MRCDCRNWDGWVESLRLHRLSRVDKIGHGPYEREQEVMVSIVHWIRFQMCCYSVEMRLHWSFNSDIALVDFFWKVSLLFTRVHYFARNIQIWGNILPCGHFLREFITPAPAQQAGKPNAETPSACGLRLQPAAQQHLQAALQPGHATCGGPALRFGGSASPPAGTRCGATLRRQRLRLRGRGCWAR